MKSIQNYYYLFINSDDNADGLTNCKNINFNLASILQSAPNRQFIEEQAYCYVKMNYFALDVGTDNANIGTTTTIQVRLGGTIFPNSFESQPLSAGVRNNLVSSNILAVVPTGRVDATNFNSEFLYSNMDFDNGYVVMGNPFKGQLNIQLTDQDGTALVDAISSGKSYNMKLEIYFPDDSEFRNIASNQII
tara:strand:- start:299 stop:871 length:573 start_codon:yes stop_codon:yes gene_type:complete